MKWHDWKNILTFPFWCENMLGNKLRSAHGPKVLLGRLISLFSPWTQIKGSWNLVKCQVLFMTWTMDSASYFCQCPKGQIITCRSVGCFSVCTLQVIHRGSQCSDSCWFCISRTNLLFGPFWKAVVKPLSSPGRLLAPCAFLMVVLAQTSVQLCSELTGKFIQAAFPFCNEKKKKEKILYVAFK